MFSVLVTHCKESLTASQNKSGWFEWNREIKAGQKGPNLASEGDTIALPSSSKMLDEDVQSHQWFLARMSHAFYFKNDWLQNLTASVSVWDNQARIQRLAQSDDILLLPNRVFGYILQTGSWGKDSFSIGRSWCAADKLQSLLRPLRQSHLAHCRQRSKELGRAADPGRSQVHLVVTCRAPFSPQRYRKGPVI